MQMQIYDIRNLHRFHILLFWIHVGDNAFMLIPRKFKRINELHSVLNLSDDCQLVKKLNQVWDEWKSPSHFFLGKAQQLLSTDSTNPKHQLNTYFSLFTFCYNEFYSLSQYPSTEKSYDLARESTQVSTSKLYLWV